MRVMALVLASALAVCFMNPASAATKRSASADVANPDRSVYPNSRGCSAYCYRSGRQKIQSQKHNH
jgi:hypothetical protein